MSTLVGQLQGRARKDKQIQIRNTNLKKLVSSNGHAALSIFCLFCLLAGEQSEQTIPTYVLDLSI